MSKSGDLFIRQMEEDGQLDAARIHFEEQEYLHDGKN